MQFDTNELVAAMRRALPPGTADVGLHEPEFLGNEAKYLQDCIDTGWVSYLGKYVDQFERTLAQRTGRKHAFAAVNGTAALHAALVVLGVQSGDEVILPSVTFVASANSVVQAGATPHLVDCESQTLGLDIARLRDHLRAVAEKKQNALINRHTGRRIAAIVPVHVFGQPIDHEALDEVAREFGLPVLTDATESLAQMERLDQFIAEKRQLAKVYRAALSEVGGVEVMQDPAGTQSNYWLVAIKLDPSLKSKRDEILDTLHAAGLKCRPLWTPMHMLPMFSSAPRMDDLSVTEDMFARVINLPSSPRLGRRLA
jgi:dTDP-4-amino-4,6-dideoxygalactose transaminase